MEGVPAAVPAIPLAPRKYQIELLEEALKRNTIVCLGTGTGKTFIAIMAIKEFAHTTKKPLHEGGKRIAFVVPNVALVSQQANALRCHAHLRVGQYVGSANSIDVWDKTTWINELEQQQVIVMTAQVLLNILNSGFLGIWQLSLLVFDECHHATGNHPYRQIMSHFDQETRWESQWRERPRVLGLTASIVTKKCKANQVAGMIARLETTLKSQCATASDQTATHLHGTKPDEQTVIYRDPDEQSMPLDVVTLLEEAVDFLGDAGCGNSEKLEKFCGHTKKILSAVASLASDVGPWSCQLALEENMKQLEEVKRFMDDQSLACCLVSWCETQLAVALRMCQRFTPLNSCLRFRLSGMSYKARALIQCLLKFCSDTSSDGLPSTDLRALVFVERRITAKMLCRFLNAYCQNGDSGGGLSFVRVDWTVGSGRTSFDGSEEADDPQSKMALERFRNGEVNVLVTTSATEEGVDVPSCNLVVQFDPPNNVRGYVQAKGRARKIPSMYLVFVSESRQEELQDQLEVFKETEEVLYKLAKEGNKVGESVQPELIHMPEYRTPTGATASMTSSADILNRYCAALPQDCYTQPFPVFRVVEKGVQSYSAKVFLPVTCPFKKAIESYRWGSKKLAKHHAAVLMVTELHKRGHLTDHLLPAIVWEKKIKKKKKPKTFGFGRYNVKLASALVGWRLCVEEAVYVYRLEFESKGNLPEQGNQALGIVFPRPLPKIPQFSIFEDSSEIRVSVVPCSEVRLSARELANIAEFHHLFFSNVLRITGDENEMQMDVASDVRAYKVVPLRFVRKPPPSQWFISTQYLKEIATDRRQWRRRAFATVPLLVEMTGGLVQWTLWSIDSRLLDRLSKRGIWHRIEQQDWESLVDAVVSPFYLRSQGANRFLFRGVSIRRDLTPESPFVDPEKASSFADYTFKQHGVLISEEGRQRPLLEVSGISLKNLNCLSPVQRRQTSRGTLLLIPETCEQHWLPVPLWSLAKFVPSILYRMESLLVAEELLTTITSSRPFAVRQRPVVERTRKAPGVNFDKLSAVCATTDDASGVACDEILVALTTANAQVVFNSERLELLGDSFLKCAASVSLFFGFENENEGQLTNRRKKFVGNRDLYKLGEAKGLPGYVFAKRFDPSAKSWLPPGYVATTEAARSRLLGQDMHGKTIADAVEALLGLFLDRCGCSNALKYLEWIGMELTETTYDIFSADVVNLKPADKSCSPDEVCLFCDFDDFERSIGYSFGNRRLLLEALTHASYYFNRLTDCYQRQEFLGDALLDFMVTLYVYEANPNLDPGQLTDLRSAIVCNESFARLAVKAGFHRHLKAFSPSLFADIDSFVKTLAGESMDEISSDDGIKPEELEESATADIVLFEGESPKVLSDVFESVAAAVFIDSGMSMETVWKVFYPLMKDVIVQYTKNCPRHPVSVIHEKGFSVGEARIHTGGYGFVCTVQLPSETVEGFGKTVKAARLNVAKRALKRLSQLENN